MVVPQDEQDTEQDEQTCLLCYEESQVQPLHCCGKEICARCARLLRRRTFLVNPQPLCPFCRNPWEGASTAEAAIRSVVFSELITGRSSRLMSSGSRGSVQRISIMLLLAPHLGRALEVASEALVDVAAKGTARAAAAVAAKLCTEWPSVEQCLLSSLRRFWEDSGWQKLPSS